MVNFNKGRASSHHRRGISTIVGGAIFLILFASAFSTFFIAMDVQRDTINTQRTISDNIMEKSKENFVIAVSTDDTQNNKLAIQVKNLGTNPVEIGNIWIINKSGNFPAQKHLIDYKDSVIPSGYGTDILDSTPLFMYADDYDIKVISTLGTIEKSSLTIGSGNNLRSTLIAIPPEVKVGQNVTLTMHVENIGNSKLLNVAPVNDTGKLHPNISPEFTTPHPTPPQPIDLDPGEGAFFTWEYETTGTANTIVEFNANATATEDITGFVMQSNTAYADIELKEPDVSEIIVLTQDLASRPEIFMTIPGPFGSDWPDKGLWGMNLVNPTQQEMNVTKIVISAIIPRSDEGDQVFTQFPDCAPENIWPGTGTWSCPAPNQLVWKNGPDDPQIIQPTSVEPFLARVGTGFITDSFFDIETVLVQGNVFTTAGEFGKAGYGSAMDFAPQSIVNVFLSNGTQAFDNNDILPNMTGILGSEVVTFNATMAEFSLNAATEISEGRLIINVPKGWSVPIIQSNVGFNAPQVFTFIDGSHQIIAELSAALDGTVGNEARTVQFTSQAPAVTNTQMYVMYVLADGETNVNQYALGPISEVILHVEP